MTDPLVIALTPIVIYLVTLIVAWMIKAIPANIRGFVTIAIVALLSAVGAWILGAIEIGGSWLSQFLLGLLAVFINEMIKQLKKIGQTNS